MPTTSPTVHDQIMQTFSTPEWCNFLLPLAHDDLFDFILQSLIQEHQTSSSDQLTLIVDAHTAQHMPALQKLSHAQHIYTAQATPTLSDIIPTPNLDLPTGHRLFILLSPSTSCLITQVPASENHINGYWSVHSEAITQSAQLILSATPLSTPTALVDQGSFALSPLAMNLIRQVEYFLIQQHQAATVQKNDLALILDILKSLSVRRSTHELLYVFVEKITHSIPAARCSVVRIWNDANEAHVLASHEDSSVDGMVIQLDKYPEILNTLKTTTTTIINDIDADPITSPIAHHLAPLGIRSILVVPIVMNNTKVGTFLLRIIRKDTAFTQREIDFCRIASETAANAIERSDLFDTIQQSNRTLERLATTDSLTGLYNRRYFMERLEDEIARATRYKTPLSCIIIDIDDFKSINDTYGHLQGDAILKEVSRRTLISIRTNDVVARYGGEEFIILLPQTDLEGSTTHATRLVNNIPHPSYKGLPDTRKITVSVGLACMDSSTPISADTLIKAADDALYEAKRTGKNKVVIAH